MPKIKKSTKADMSAMTSDTVALRKVRNQTVVSKIKIPRKSKSAKKKATNRKFKEANKWAQSILTDPAMDKLYAKGIKSKFGNTQSVAVQDYMKGPEIHYINTEKYTGAVGDELRIKATDNFQVTEVKVRIYEKDGKKLVEKGSAVRYSRKPVMWIYTLTVGSTDVDGTVIKAIAFDRPGNETEKEVKVESKL